MVGEPKTIYCSFCGKSQHEVAKLIAGPTMFICHECVELCHDICMEARGEHLEERATALSADWLKRAADLRRLIEALTSSSADMIESIRGPWIMRASRDTPNGPVNIVVGRRSNGAGDISITFTDALDDLLLVAKEVAAERAGAGHSQAKTWIVEGVEMSLSISATALLHEFERVAEHLKLHELLPPSPESLSPDIDYIRRTIDNIVDPERNPANRRAIAGVLRDALNKLAYTR